ncbi:hypothetical protein G9A89_005308 [Geosiphon pyriformis]|nr:hypothetical protein G9A89_005308 [Geosiphon pyriformis]
MSDSEHEVQELNGSDDTTKSNSSPPAKKRKRLSSTTSKKSTVSKPKSNSNSKSASSSSTSVSKTESSSGTAKKGTSGNKWSQEEDKILLTEIIALLPPIPWTQIAEKLEGRDATSAKNRWAGIRRSIAKGGGLSIFGGDKE